MSKKKKNMVRKDQYRQDPNMYIHVDSYDEDDWWASYMEDLYSYNYKKLEKTDEGYLKGRAVATNTGIFPYMASDGSTINELRCGAEVFAPSSVESLNNVSLTNDHPTVFVDSTNFKEYQVGLVGEGVTTDTVNGFISVPVLIQDATAVEDVVNGKRGLSCGYTCDIIEKSGVWGGMPYDCIQTNIRYNHLAIVDRGRAGDDATLKMDSKPLTGLDSKKDSKNNDETNNEKQGVMMKIKLDGISYEAEDRVVEHYDAQKARADKAEEEKDELALALGKKDEALEAKEAVVAVLEGEKVKLQEQLDNSINKDELGALLALTVKVDKACADFGVEVTDSMSNMDKKVAVIKKAKSLDEAEWFTNVVAVDSVFDIVLLDGADKKKEEDATKKDIADTINKDKKDEAPEKKADTYEQAKARADEASRNAWRKK